MYNQIFFTNILRILDERGMAKNELSEKAGVSVSFLSDLTNGKANPSLKVMESIAEALETPLPMLLEHTDMDAEALNALACRGVDIAACGLCLDFYHLKEKLQVGRTTNMLEIAETALQAGRVIRP